MGEQQPSYVTLRSRRPAAADGNSDMSSVDSTYGSGAGDGTARSATHDISRVSYHVKHLDAFAKTLEESASRAFPNRGRSSQRYQKVHALLLHWKSDDLFVLPELEDLERCLREDYSFETEVFPIPSENSHLELMLRLGAMIKEHESDDTLFVVYYGGHARIDESRQSTWCATRHSNSPWLQWSAIQTLLERSISDCLILLDCCAGAASATFPTGKSITETISASSWDAIAPDPGRYSFTNALIEVLSEWRLRTFSAAMLHAEVLARLKHPRPVTINGKLFEARSTPVHFMMTSNHKAPSIEISRIIPEGQRPPSPPEDAPTLDAPEAKSASGRGPVDGFAPEPNEDEPHVMISLALEADQSLDINAWQRWLSDFPGLAKYVKVQGAFQSHSTLILLSMPVMIWDLLPEDRACSFVAFIRSNNLLNSGPPSEPEDVSNPVPLPEQALWDLHEGPRQYDEQVSELRGLIPVRSLPSLAGALTDMSSSRIERPADYSPVASSSRSAMFGEENISPNPALSRSLSGSFMGIQGRGDSIHRTMILNQQRSSRKTLYGSGINVPEGPALSSHVSTRLEDYFQRESYPSVAVTEFIASNVGIEVSDVDRWFHHRRQRELMERNLQNLRIDDRPPEYRDTSRMILPGRLYDLLKIVSSPRILLVDLRSPSDFARSHIHGAANLRLPAAFVQNNSLEMVERAFTDPESQRAFSAWHTARCVVFYDRLVEFTWECPVADALLEKFRNHNWHGQTFILKGHYREFSATFDHYIVGDKMSQQARDYVESQRGQAAPSEDQLRREQEEYEAWLQLVEIEDHSVTTSSRQAQKMQAVEEHQSRLQSEFEARFPVLSEKGRAFQPNPADVSRLDSQPSAGPIQGRDNFDRKLPLVEPLMRGLEKMQQDPMPASGQQEAPSRAAELKRAEALEEMETGGDQAQDESGLPGAEGVSDTSKRARDQVFRIRPRSTRQ